jgi:hypothetical protein
VSFPLTDIPPVSHSPALIHQRFDISQSGGFKVPKPVLKVQELIAGKTLTFSCLEVAVELEQIEVTYTYSQNYVGAPDRVPYPKKMVLTNDLWLRVTYNGRFSSWESKWSYRKTTFNVAFLDQARGIFLSEPQQSIRDIAELW